MNTFRRGFTLIELLLVIAILAVISSMSLAVMRGAQEDAKASATSSRIHRIEGIMQLALEDYEVRRLPISLAELKAFVRQNRLPGVNLMVQVRNLKRRIVTDLISAEVPRPLFSSGTFLANPDLGRFPTQQVSLAAPAGYDQGFAQWLDDKYPNPAFSSGPTLRVRLQALAPSGVVSWRRFNGNADFNLPGEYLYEILRRVDVDGSSGVEGLGNSAIGDSDDDGFLEVVDAWGESMQLRILQIMTQDPDHETSVDSDVWNDVIATDWTAKQTGAANPNAGLPIGYTTLNSVIPRELYKVRFHVVSPTIDAF